MLGAAGERFEYFNTKTIYSSDSEGYVEEETDYFHRDGSNLTIDDASKYDDALDFTTSWTRDSPPTSGIESQLLRDLFAQQLLNDRRAFHDLITLQIYDPANLIHFETVILWNSKNYRIVEISTNFKTALVAMTIQQINNSGDVGYEIISSYKNEELITES